MSPPPSLSARLYARAILLSLALAMLMLWLIGMVGMALSVAMVDKVRGSGSAINVAGSLRMQSHRMGGLVLAGRLDEVPDRRALDAAMRRFEASLSHPSLVTMQARNPDGRYAQMLRAVQEDWVRELKPLLLAQPAQRGTAATLQHRELLARIDAYVDDINRMVAELEHDTETKISELRTLLGVALGLAFLVMVAVLYGVSTRVILPLNRLVEAANHIATGDFAARAAHTGADELGRVGVAFNFMADELSKLYGRLEQRVNEKTEQLTRSNRSLELLYHSISRLYNAPVAPETYRDMLHDLEAVLDLRQSMACLLPERDGLPRILASTLDSGPGLGLCTAMQCIDCAQRGEAWQQESTDGSTVHTVPLRDNEQQYGVLRISLPPGRVLEAWQSQLIEALAQHIGIAIGIAHQAERERRLALMDERSVIARELHDSLAQALSYMKIQVVLLQQALASARRREEADAILLDLREGINAAYRQLRELLSTFRLRMEGDFHNLLRRTLDEFAQRGALAVDFEAHLGDVHLSPNQEIHVLHIVREALNNVLRHAHASRVRVTLRADAARRLDVSIEDDGAGMPELPPGNGHYGLAIMRERARSLSGSIEFGPATPRGTVVCLRFDAGDGGTHSAFQEEHA